MALVRVSEPAAPRPGDYVTIATAAPGQFALTWKVVSINTSDDIEFGVLPYAILESGQTGRRRYELLDNLTLYRRSQQ